MIVDKVYSSENLLELGLSLGTPTPAPNGELIKEVRRQLKEKAPTGSQSAKYGVGPFPLHTDTVFWNTPVKYVLLRAYGDVRRPTTVISFEELFDKCSSKIRNLIKDSVWHVRAGRTMNDAAKDISDELRHLVMTEGHAIDWTGSTALLINNWIALHGRGDMPEDEGERVIQRIYVR
jgi:alpha-ketoglutarate-dependent taurine dioxygenase